MGKDEYQAYFGAGQSVGFGVSLLSTGEAPSFRVFVKQVLTGSPADLAGFARGDEIVSVGPDAGGLAAVKDMDAVSFNAAITAGGVAGVSRALQVIPVGLTDPEARSMVSSAYDLDPVPAAAVKVFPGTQTGYVQLRTFIPAAEGLLRDAFRKLKEGGARNVVVDLRYNGGGSLDTAVVLADLLGQGLVPQPMFTLTYNSKHAGGQLAHFAGEQDGAAFQRVAFVTTDASASASELVPNALDAYPLNVPIAFAGGRTHGKPVGQFVWSLEGCDSVLFLISFRLENAEGHTDYFEGLPDATSHAPLCEAADDLAYPMDSTDEPSTAAAVYFAEHGSCPPGPAARARAAAPRPDQLVGWGAGQAGRDMPGTY